MRQVKSERDEQGQIVVAFAALLTVLVLFTGLALDAGLLYVTKAKLSSAVDAGCLMGMKSLSLGQSKAATLATDAFNANFGANPPKPTITFPTDAYGDQQVNISATATVNTIFMRILPSFSTVSIADVATATRGKLAMSIVLDRSGSMSSDGGGTALQSAVPAFVADFSNTNDEVALISFSSGATVNFPINYNFITPITNAVKGLSFSGGTFGTGAGTNSASAAMGPPMSMADQQNNAVVAQPGQNLTKVMVYFTDGLMNTVQDTFTCVINNTPTPELINYGGFDTGSQVDIFAPTNGTTLGSYSGGFPYDTKGDICQNPKNVNTTKFYSQQYGMQESFTRATVTAEAQYRAIYTANAMRTERSPSYIFTIGLGTNVSSSTQAFLAQLANDPSYPTYIKGQPAGLFLYVPNCPGTTCTAELNTAFQTIASKVLLRLTQ
jgi:Flp pilus assembly protein TadG